jgi:hypothetical protein
MAWSFVDGASNAGSTFRIGAWQAVQLADSAALSIPIFRAIAADCPFVKVAAALECGSERFQMREAPRSSPAPPWQPLVAQESEPSTLDVPVCSAEAASDKQAETITVMNRRYLRISYVF